MSHACFAGKSNSMKINWKLKNPIIKRPIQKWVLKLYREVRVSVTNIGIHLLWSKCLSLLAPTRFLTMCMRWSKSSKDAPSSVPGCSQFLLPPDPLRLRVISLHLWGCVWVSYLSFLCESLLSCCSEGAEPILLNLFFRPTFEMSQLSNFYLFSLPMLNLPNEGLLLHR